MSERPDNANSKQLTEERVVEIVNAQITSALRRVLRDMIETEFKQLLQAHTLDIQDQREQDIRTAEIRQRQYVDTAVQRLEDRITERLDTIVATLADTNEALVQMRSALEARLSSQDAFMRDRWKAVEFRVTAHENSTNARLTSIERSAGDRDDMITANERHINNLLVFAERVGTQVDSIMKRDEEHKREFKALKDSTDEMHAVIMAQEEHRKRWERRRAMVLDFLSSKTGKRLITAGATALTILAGHVERVWERVFDLFGF